MTAEPSRVVIVGIGDDGYTGLSDPAKVVLAEADLILGAPAVLRHVADLGAPKVELDSEMARATDQVRSAMTSRRPVLLSPGDPLYYGIARYLCDRLGKDHFEVIPHVSSMQLALPTPS